MTPFRSHFLVLLTTVVGLALSSSAHALADGLIDNPFIEGGCLKQRKANWPSIRVCNSEDTEESIELGYCRQETDFDYMEIRFGGKNLGSAIFETWILQIVLSEILHVPTTVDTRLGKFGASLYDRLPPKRIGAATDWGCLETGTRVGDCRLHQTGTTEETYQSCCHYVPEAWHEDMVYEKQIELGVLEPDLNLLGSIAENSFWAVPKFTAERDPTLLSYIGLAGEHNRRKLAERFLRPTRWHDYCEDVSSTNCENDTAATRPPTFDETSQGVGSRFFVPGVYSGHFRKTDKNDCDKNPQTCTGHIMDYPCFWPTVTLPQIHHLNMALQGDGPEELSWGYSYRDLIDIFYASNATKSDLLAVWGIPDVIYQQFVGTDMELTIVASPPVSLECLNHRVDRASRCSSDYQTRVGDKRGACGASPVSIRKLIGPRLADITYDGSKPSEFHSPAYATLKAFQISTAETGQLYDYSLAYPEDRQREAICQWVLDNFDKVISFIPKSYPRVVHKESGFTVEPVRLATLCLAAIGILLVAVMTFGVYRHRKRRVIIRAQSEILYLRLAGLFLIAVGSMFLALPPTKFLCISTAWLTNLGYVLELIPLCVKRGTIYIEMMAARKPRRVVLSRLALFGPVALSSCCVLAFLLVWTIVDPPSKETEYDMKEPGSGIVLDSTVVRISYYCHSDEDAWQYSSAIWQMVVLIFVMARTYQTRRFRKEAKEWYTLTIVVYTHFVFLCIRLFILHLESSGVKGTDAMLYRSISYSLDTIATTSIYFVSKVLEEDKAGEDGESSSFSVGESTTVTQIRILAAVAQANHGMKPTELDNVLNGELQSSNNSESQSVPFPAVDFVESEGGVLPRELGPVFEGRACQPIYCRSCGQAMDVCGRCWEMRDDSSQ